MSNATATQCHLVFLLYRWNPAERNRHISHWNNLRTASSISVACRFSDKAAPSWAWLYIGRTSPGKGAKSPHLEGSDIQIPSRWDNNATRQSYHESCNDRNSRRIGRRVLGCDECCRCSKRDRWCYPQSGERLRESRRTPHSTLKFLESLWACCSDLT